MLAACICYYDGYSMKEAGTWFGSNSQYQFFVWHLRYLKWWLIHVTVFWVVMLDTTVSEALAAFILRVKKSFHFTFWVSFRKHALL